MHRLKSSSLPVAVRRGPPRTLLEMSAAASLLHAATYGLRAVHACAQALDLTVVQSVVQ